MNGRIEMCISMHTPGTGGAAQKPSLKSVLEFGNRVEVSHVGQENTGADSQ
jgi:hypothetical protein